MSSFVNTERFVAIDPLALIFSEKFYLILIELLHPHVPVLADVLKSMPAEEREATLRRANSLAVYAHAVQEAGKAVHEG